MNDKLWEIPESWKWCTIGDLGKIVSGGTPSTKRSDYWGGEIPWISPSDLSNYNGKVISGGKKTLSELGLQNSSAKMMPEGSVHFSTRAPIGYVVISSEQLSTNQGFKSIVPDQGVYNEYLYYYLKGSTHLAERYATGTTFKELSGRSFARIPFPLPPLPDQRRIVAKIESLFTEIDQGVASLEKARAQLEIYRQAVLKHAFEGKLTEKWREENADKLETPEELLERIRVEREREYQHMLLDWHENEGKGRKPKRPSTNNEAEDPVIGYPSIPSEWSYINLGQVVSDIEAGKSFRCEERTPRGSEIGVAKVSAVSWGEYDENESKTCIDESRVNEQILIQVGDFLFSRANTIELVGACVIAQNVTKRIMLSDKTLRISFSGIAPQYVLFYLRSWLGRREITRRATGNQHSMRNIGQARIRDIKIPICSSVEASVIESIVETNTRMVDRIEGRIESEIVRAKSLRRSILKDAFSGKLVQSTQ